MLSLSKIIVLVMMILSPIFAWYEHETIMSNASGYFLVFVLGLSLTAGVANSIELDRLWNHSDEEG